MDANKQMIDIKRCVIHAGSDKIHKLKYIEWMKKPKKKFLHHNRTACGARTTHMSRISAEEVKHLSDSLLCKRCFPNAA